MFFFDLEPGSSLAYRKVNEDLYNITASDYVLSVDNGAEDWTILLPSPVGITGKVYIIKRFDNTSTGGLVLDSVEGLIQSSLGAFLTSVTIYPWGAGVGFLNKLTVMSNGTNWEYIL